MKNEIIDVEDEWIGVQVEDNNRNIHKVAVDIDGGNIRGQDHDAYPDKFHERSMIDENEPVNQARRYARYVVERERGYDTIAWRQHPDHHLAAALAVAQLDTDEVLAHFGELYDQVRSRHTDIERPVELPEGARPGHYSYKQNIYLGVSPDTLESLADSLGGHELPTEAVEGDDSLEHRLTALLDAADRASLITLADLTVAAVSGVHVHWDDASGTYHTEYNRQRDIDRDPDAQLDILPFIPETPEDFRAQLIRNLLCIVRDCYIEMGVTPPEPFRIQGLGRHRPATLYEQFDYYQRYHDPDADIDWLALEPSDHREQRQ